MRRRSGDEVDRMDTYEKWNCIFWLTVASFVFFSFFFWKGVGVRRKKREAGFGP